MANTLGRHLVLRIEIQSQLQLPLGAVIAGFEEKSESEIRMAGSVVWEQPDGALQHVDRFGDLLSQMLHAQGDSAGSAGRSLTIKGMSTRIGRLRGTWRIRGLRGSGSATNAPGFLCGRVYAHFNCVTESPGLACKKLIVVAARI
jgi:hypothetical protein